MKHRIALITVFTMAALTLVVIVGNSLSITVAAADYLLEWVVYGLLMALAVALSIPLHNGKLSVGHAIGIMAFLSTPANAFPIMTVAIASGSGLGALIEVVRSRQYQQPIDRLYALILLVAQQTLSFYVAGRAYLLLDGQLPIGADFERHGLQMAIFALLYVAIYLATLAIQTHFVIYVGERVMRTNGLTIVTLILMPIPFSFVGSVVARSQTSLMLFTVTIVGAALIIFGLYSLSLIQQKLRRQLSEKNIMVAMTDAMRGNLNLNELLELTHQEVSRMLHIKDFTVALLDELGNIGYPLIVKNDVEIPRQMDDPLPHDAGLIQRVIATNQALVLQDHLEAYLDDNGNSRSTNLSGWLGIPLQAHDHVLGALVVQSHTGRRFRREDIDLLQTMTNTAAIAIDNALLYRQQVHRAERLAKLNMITTTLTHSLSYTEVIETVVTSAPLIADAAAVALYQLSPEVGFMLVEQRELDPLTVPPLQTKPHHPTVREAITVTSPGAATPDLRRKLEASNLQSLIELPLWMRDQQIGVLALYFEEPQLFAYEQLDLLQAYATQVTQALHNATTFTQTDHALEMRVQQLSILAELGQMLTASFKNADRVFETILNYVITVTRAPHGAIIMQNDNGMLYVPAQYGYPQDLFSSVAILREGMVGQVIQEGIVVQCDDTHEVEDCAPLLPTTRSILLVPIWRADVCVGLIVLESEEVGCFSQDDSGFLQQVAHQGIIAIENTQLFERVRQARDNMAVILNAMEEGILLLGADGTVIQANPRIDLLGLESHYLVQQPITASISEGDGNVLTRLGFTSRREIENLLGRLNDPAIWQKYDSHGYTLELDDGVKHIQRQVIPVRNDQRRVVAALLVYYNKTEEYELVRARQMFSRMIVHDLRSPLTAVTASLRLFQELIPEESKHRHILERAVDASERAIRTVLLRVDSLLDIAKMESGTLDLEPEIAHLPDLVDKVRTQLAPLATELNITIKTEYMDELPLLLIDGEKTERIIMNLMDNALKHSPENATIILRATQSYDKQLQVDIIDQGPGVPDNYKDRLFDQFVQIEGQHGKRRGVGLGLTFCKLAVQAQGGRIWISDNPDGGGIFSFTLPVAQISEPID
ncbi:MAG: GAF domain-containing protein [Anaerolineae bacterium]|nr:GAF domain-containing protein [Anaerolineae bacterium]